MSYIILIILLHLGYKISGFEVDETLRIAGCIVKCTNPSCRKECTDNPPSIGVNTIDYAANFNASLHCRDTNFLTLMHNPGFYVIEESVLNDTWRNAIISNGTTSSFSNLLPGVQYQYRAYRVTKNGISMPETTDIFITQQARRVPKAVKSISVDTLRSDTMNPKYLQAEITFVPDEERCCFYDALSWSESESLTIFNINATRHFRFHLHRLGYAENNTIIIAAKNAGSSRSSTNVSYSFITPSCLEFHKNLTICPPNQVEGLRMTQVHQRGSRINLKIQWNKPDYRPDNYTIQILIIDEIEKPQDITLFGNATEFIYSIEKFELPYVISIVAESLGGTSPPVSIFGRLDPDTNVLSNAINEGLIIVSAAIIFVIFITTCIYCRRKRMNRYHNHEKYCTNLKTKSNLTTLYEKSLKSTSEIESRIDDTPLIPKDQFEIRPSQLRIKDILGSGISGVVRFGILQINPNKSIGVAVKMLKDCPSADELRNFQQEISIMKSAGTHPNIVSIIGYSMVDMRPILIVEYCSKGDLQSYLRHIWKDMVLNVSDEKAQCKLSLKNPHRNSNYPFLLYQNQDAVSNQLYDIQQEIINTAEENTVADLLNFARQVAYGMEYLSLNRIVHRDLAARNVLVCADRTVKISDFGLSRDVYRQNVYKKRGDGKLPLKWMALEALTHQVYTTQSDVWSFGILLWEIVTLGCHPYPETPTNMILQLLKSGYRMPRPSNCGHELYEIMTACWRSSPRSRPTFTELKKALDKLLQSVTHHEYLNLYDPIHDTPRV